MFCCLVVANVSYSGVELRLWADCVVVPGGLFPVPGSCMLLAHMSQWTDDTVAGYSMWSRASVFLA